MPPGHVTDLYNYRTSDKWHMIDLKWTGTGRWTIQSVLSTTLEDALFSNTHDEKLQQLQQNQKIVKEKTLKHGVQFRHERKGYVNYRDFPGCILRY